MEHTQDNTVVTRYVHWDSVGDPVTLEGSWCGRWVDIRGGAIVHRHPGKARSDVHDLSVDIRSGGLRFSVRNCISRMIRGA
eukprot:2899532-Pyramimonas_sp.AAC.1